MGALEFGLAFWLAKAPQGRLQTMFGQWKKSLALSMPILLERPPEGSPMSRISLGVLCGLIFGAVDVAIMIPMSFPDKRAAMLGAFIARFAIGFVVCNIRLPWPSWLVGLFIGVLLSLPDAIITKAAAPILGTGALGGLIIGWVAGRFGR